MLAHSAFLGLVVVVVFSDGGAQNHIFGYIIGISHQMVLFFVNLFLIYLMKAPKIFGRKNSTNMPKIWQKILFDLTLKNPFV